MTVYYFFHILLKIQSTLEGDYTRTWIPESGVSGHHHKDCLLNSIIRTFLCGMKDTLKIRKKMRCWGLHKIIGSCIVWDCVIVNNEINYTWDWLCLCFYVWWCLVHNYHSLIFLVLKISYSFVYDCFSWFLGSILLQTEILINQVVFIQKQEKLCLDDYKNILSLKQQEHRCKINVLNWIERISSNVFLKFSFFESFHYLRSLISYLQIELNRKYLSVSYVSHQFLPIWQQTGILHLPSSTVQAR